MKLQRLNCNNGWLVNFLEISAFLQIGVRQKKKIVKFFIKKLAKKKLLWYNILEIGMQNPKKIYFRRSLK